MSKVVHTRHHTLAQANLVVYRNSHLSSYMYALDTRLETQPHFLTNPLPSFKPYSFSTQTAIKPTSQNPLSSISLTIITMPVTTVAKTALQAGECTVDIRGYVD
jgi:hypothetical protein